MVSLICNGIVDCSYFLKGWNTFTRPQIFWSDSHIIQKCVTGSSVCLCFHVCVCLHIFCWHSSDYSSQCSDALRDAVEEHLFRSVEGQAASDEEEDKWSGEQQRRVEEVKRILSRLSCCGERYRTPAPLKAPASVCQICITLLFLYWPVLNMQTINAVLQVYAHSTIKAI